MKNETRRLLKEFIKGIPVSKRQLNPDLNHPNDFKRLIRVSNNLVVDKDTIDEGEIRSMCEEVGGSVYLSLIDDPLFFEEFASPLFSKIDNAKTIIATYREIV